MRPLEAGDELLIVNDRGAKADKDMKFLFEVALFEPQVIEGEPIITALNQFIGTVSDIIESFDSHIFWSA